MKKLLALGILIFTGCASQKPLTYYTMTIPWEDPSAEVVRVVTDRPTLDITEEQWQSYRGYDVYTMDCDNEYFPNKKEKDICIVKENRL